LRVSSTLGKKDPGYKVPDYIRPGEPGEERKSMRYSGVERLYDMGDGDLGVCYRHLYKRLSASMAGGLAFGMDWQTARQFYPQTVTMMQTILKIHKRSGHNEA